MSSPLKKIRTVKKTTLRSNIKDQFSKQIERIPEMEGLQITGHPINFYPQSFLLNLKDITNIILLSSFLNSLYSEFSSWLSLY